MIKIIGNETNDEYIELFASEYKKQIYNNKSSVDMTSISGEQHTLLALSIFRAEINEGGFCQLIQNGYGAYIFDNPFAMAMRLWGADEFSKIVYKAKKIYDKHKEDLEKDRTEEEFMAMYEQYEAFDDLEEAYFYLEDDLLHIVATYVREHIELFA